MDKQLNWGDELCGVKVTPESWAGGVVELQGGGWIQPLYFPQGFDYIETGCFYSRKEDGCDHCEEQGYDPQYTRPIFPPRSWAGKTDAELFDAVFGNPYFGTIFRYDWDWGGRQHYREVRIHISGAVNEMGPGDVDGPVKQHGSLNTFSWLDAERLARVILALQNAQVLARRLQQ